MWLLGSFTSYLSVFQSYQEDGMGIMKVCEATFEVCNKSCLQQESKPKALRANRLATQMDRVKRIWYFSSMRAAKVQASLHICAVSSEPSLLAHTSIESRGTFRQKARSLAPLNGWACAVKICHKFAWCGPIDFWIIWTATMGSSDPGGLSF